MVGVPGPGVAGQGTLGKGRVLGGVQGELVLATRRQGREHRQPGGDVGVAGGRGVLRPDHQHPRDRYPAECTFRTAPARAAGAERDGGFDARVGEGRQARHGALTAHHLCGDGAEGMPRHADTFEIHAPRERVPIDRVPRFELIHHGGDVLYPKHGVLQVGGAV